MLNRDAILKADDLKREEVSVPEWGGAVFVRTMTGSEKDAFDESNMVEVPSTRKNAKKGETESKFSFIGYRARLFAATVCDESGNLLFTLADAVVLADKSAAALDRVLEVAKRLNAVTKADVEDLAKN